MKKFFFAICCLCNTHLWAQNYEHEKIQLLSRWDDSNIVVLSQVGSRYSGIWGYAANGREYALLGTENGLHIIDVTDPYIPVRVARIYGRRNGCTWREYKVYQHYVYMVSDDPIVNSLQIVDLSFLPDSAALIYDDATVFKQSHTIYIDGDKLYSGSTTFANGYSAMSVYSLVNPALPVLLRKLEQDYGSMIGGVHDMFVRNDTIYASCGNDGLFVFNLDTNHHFQLIGSLTQYPFQGYNHSSCLTADGNHLVMLDEVPAGLPAKSVLINAPNDLEVIDTFSSGSLATPHNPFLCDNNRVAVAYYEDGLQIFDFTDPANPVRTGYFDTHYQTTSTDTINGTYRGAWGAYTQLPSKRIIVSDMQNGLFVLDADSALGITRVNTATKEVAANAITIYPNPVTDKFRIETGGLKIERAVLYNESGQAIKRFKNFNGDMIVSDLSKGFYILEVKTGGTTSSVKLIKE